MKTTINACDPETSDPTNTFLFYEKYWKMCHNAKSMKPLNDCPGAVYYTFLKNKFSEIYKRYNNGTGNICT